MSQRELDLFEWGSPYMGQLCECAPQIVWADRNAELLGVGLDAQEDCLRGKAPVSHIAMAGQASEYRPIP
jgi:hypothetical protein